MRTDKFFDESKEQSQVKAEIVEKYFYAWAAIIIGAQRTHRPGKEHRIGYVDLFAGPGRYKDGAVSTPLRVIQKAIEKPEYAARLVTVFNDKDEDNVRTLEEAIRALPGVETLAYKPEVWNEEVGNNIARHFEQIHTIPILAFVDPWGYKGLTLQLVNAFLKDWGCDCIFFFNYNRINMGLSNPLVREHMRSLFGRERADQLARDLEGMTPEQRESTIVNELAVALRTHGHRYVLPFCFKDASGRRTSHHLILVTKNFKGYEVMKDVMAKSSSEESQGVPSFTYSPAVDTRQALLFEFNRPLEDLRGILLEKFAGQTLTMRQVYEKHSVDTPYLTKHYKAVLKQLEDEGIIKTNRGNRSKKGFADDITATFPKRSK